MSLSAIVELLLVLGLMVLVHEFGHFAVAKLCGVRVEAFAIGFGKRLVGLTRGGTEYRINILPLGGYVKMAGEMPGEGTGTSDPGELQNHPRWQRVLIAVAGPVANFILAFVLMTGGYMLHNEVERYVSGPAHTDYIPINTPAAHAGIRSGDTIVHYDTIENPSWETVGLRSLLNLNQTIPFSFLHNGQRTDTSIRVDAPGGAENFSLDKLGLVPRMQETPVQVSLVSPGTPAARAGLQPNDQIATIDGIAVHSVPALLAYLQDQAGKPATLDLLRKDAAGHPQSLTIHLTPELSDAGDGTKLYRIGFAPVQPPVVVERLPLDKAVAASAAFNWKSSNLIGEVLKRMFTRKVSVRSLSGPIGIGQQVHQAAQMPGWMPLIGLMAGISLNLGIFNLLPVPILDGGMILFLFVESLIRRDLNPHIKERVYQVAFVCLIIFATMVIFNDLTKLPLFSHMKP